MNFLNYIYFDNTIGAWLMAAGIIILALLLKKYVSRYIASLLYKLVHKVWKSVDKKHFVALVIAPLELFLLALTAIFVIDGLSYPSALRFNIYHTNSQLLVQRIGITIILVLFTWLLLRLIDFIALVLQERADNTPDKSDDQLIVFFRDFLKVILGIIGILLLLKFTFGQNIGNLLTGLSIVGAALALAARESLENIIASFIIFFDKPFVTGDTLKVHQVIGTVERIGLRSTRIRTADKTLVSVPNKQMVDSIVDNWSMRTERRGEIRVELSPKTPAIAIKNILAGIKTEINRHSAINASSVYLREISKNGLLIVAEFFTVTIPMNEFEELKESINIHIKELLETNTTDIADVVGSVNIYREAPTKTTEGEA